MPWEGRVALLKQLASTMPSNGSKQLSAKMEAYSELLGYF